MTNVSYHMTVVSEETNKDYSDVLPETRSSEVTIIPL